MNKSRIANVASKEHEITEEEHRNDRQHPQKPKLVLNRLFDVKSRS